MIISHKYKFILKEEYVRHIYNGHSVDFDYLYRLPEILDSFTHVEKSIIRNKQTGQNDVNLVFRKTFDNDVVRMVALQIMRQKILSLKTLFRPD